MSHSDSERRVDVMKPLTDEARSLDRYEATARAVLEAWDSMPTPEADGVVALDEAMDKLRDVLDD